MPIPKTSREVYKTNLLKAVICQLHFSTVLLVDRQPAGFQERIRERYPFYSQRTDTPVDMPIEVIEQIPLALRASLFPETVPIHDFTSKDRKWTFSLNRDFLALTCNDYPDWEIFRDNLYLGIKALMDEFSPAVFLRIGLRYQNVIERSKLSLGNTGWSELLKPFVAGELSSVDVNEMVDETATTTLFKLDEWNGKLRFQHGLVRNIKDVSASSEQLYLLDNDLFVEGEKEVNDVYQILGYLNERNGWFFRHCITATLKQALGTRE